MIQAFVAALPADQLAKAERYMRALRRNVLSYWYATLEGREAALLEASAATMTVNILDEAVFQETFGQPYVDHRATDRLGRVVMGLELIRNCETHSPVTFDEVLVLTHTYGVPLSSGASPYREVFRWADYSAFPASYVDSSASANPNQKRARREAQAAYRLAVQRRVVLETLFDAINFFEQIDARLVAKDGPVPQWAFADFMNTDAATGQDMPMIARPIGLDTHSVFLPDIVIRHTERRSAAWEPADAHFKEAVRLSKKAVPASAREIRYRIEDENGKLAGYGGVSAGGPNVWNTWDERCHEVWMDVNRGHHYFVRASGAEIALVSNQVRNNDITAPDEDGADQLAALPGVEIGKTWLTMTETYPDLYLEARRQF